jgi:hypothetical protein
VEPSVGAGIFPDKPKCVGGENLGDVSKDLLTHTVGRLKRDRSLQEVLHAEGSGPDLGLDVLEERAPSGVVDLLL